MSWIFDISFYPFRYKMSLLRLTYFVVNVSSERSQNTVLLVSTQAVYKALHSTVRQTREGRESDKSIVGVHLPVSWAQDSGPTSRKSQSIRLEHVAH